jgi:peptide-methionine (R)-S-oxide reductase
MDGPVKYARNAGPRSSRQVTRRAFALASSAAAGLLAPSSPCSSWSAAAAVGPALAPGDANEKEEGPAPRRQRTEEEWMELLSPSQYYVLRSGGTERRYSSVLVDEVRDGTYRCAGCGTVLFGSAAKFESGTGWPSFASHVSDHVLVGGRADPAWGALASRLGWAGAELRCAACGGHLGELYGDGAAYPGTPAALTRLRYCVDGAALVFYPATAEGTPGGDPPQWRPVRGDQPESVL